MPVYKIADVVFGMTPIYGYSARLCAPYSYEGLESPSFFIKVTERDIADERSLAVQIAEKNRGKDCGVNYVSPDVFPDYYLESLIIYKKLCEYIMSNANGILLHSSAVAVDGNAYLFTAPSGTGKSTHARLWRELLGARAVMINDDKPIIRFVDGDFYVYGTPWNGKHRLGTNARAKVKAICYLSRAEDNSIKKVEPQDLIIDVLGQTILPKDKEVADKVYPFIDKLLKSVDLYKLCCNVSEEAARLSYETMSGERR